MSKREREIRQSGSRLSSDQRGISGPFDIIGDVHGCGDELEELMRKLGYTPHASGDGAFASFTPAAGRMAIFTGDIVDRGPRIADSLRIVMDMVQRGVALCVMGNHDAKFERWLAGANVKVSSGLDLTIAESELAGAAFKHEAGAFLSMLPYHCVFDQGRLVVAHAGLKANMHNRSSAAIRAFCLYGDTTGETDDNGFPVRRNWALSYTGEAKVVYGHTPVLEAEWLNHTMCIDTGCVFGGKLTALRYPELNVVSVAARHRYAQPARPLGRIARS